MADSTNVRARVGKFASRIVPNLDDRIFNRDRDRAEPASRAPRGGYHPPVFAERQPHLVVAPLEGPQSSAWVPGVRNVYFEAFQSAGEKIGGEHVSVLDVPQGASPALWHRALIDHVHDHHATHIITHIEADPGTPEQWTWDVVWNQLAQTWDGALLGVMFDSAFDTITMRSRRLARISPNFMVVDICTPMNGVMLPSRLEVGPVNMPVSQQSLGMLHERLQGLEPVHDVSFIGALYPYRVEMIEQLRSHGIDVVVNPHRSDPTTDFVSSRTNQPVWLDYMAGLAQSRMTINFSRSSAGEFEQLKTRVIEATLAGTFLLSDDRERTKLFFSEDEEYGFFPDVAHLPGVVEYWLQQPELLDRGRHAAQQRAQGIALDNFWDGITAGLRARGLPVLIES
jgi:Glycosyl transferases group 1